MSEFLVDILLPAFGLTLFSIMLGILVAVFVGRARRN